MIALARSGAHEGHWIRAETQSAGKGRMGRGWHSPIGNLYASTLVRLSGSTPPPATLALAAAIALCEAVRGHVPGVIINIKWPNDLMIGDAKLAGILLERVDDAVVIGFGANLGFHPVGLDRPVTSIAAQGVERPDPALVCEALAHSFAVWVARWREAGLDPIRTAWLSLAHPEGTALRANLGDGSALDGTFAGLGADGELQLRLADGSVRAIHAGDVFLV